MQDVPMPIGTDDKTHGEAGFGLPGLLIAILLGASCPLPSPASAAEDLRPAAEDTVSVVVPRHRIPAGDIITAADLTTVRLRPDQLGEQMITRKDEAIGMSSRRVLPAGRAIITSALRLPILVERNSLVTVTLTDGTLTLVTKGRALENGSLGQVIRILNLDTKSVIYGEVVSANTAQIF